MSGGVNSSGALYSYYIPTAGGYDRNSNLLTAVDSVMGQWNYTYDNLNRLTTAQASALPAGLTLPGSYGCWSFDPFGNRTAEAWQNTACPTPASSLAPTATYNSGNQLSWTSVNAAGSNVTYDPAGNMTYDGKNSYLYDAEGRVCAVQEVVNGTNFLTGYIYDAGGTRVAKGSLQSLSCNFSSNGFTTNTSWVLGPGGEQVTEYAVSGGASTWTHTNVFAGGKLLATYNGSDTYFALEDWLGSKRVEIDATGHCAATFASLPFGNTPSNGNSYQLGTLPGYQLCGDATEHHFTGKERDTESGNDYFGARYYASSMGRWLSPDWSAKVMPVPYAKLDNPQSLNLYSYVWNNPLSRNDPDGHTVPDSCAKDSKCSITVKVNVILDKNAKLTKADWKAFQKDFLGKAQKDFGNSNIKLDYTFTNGSMSDDGAVKGAKSGYLNFVATDKEPGGTDGGSQTTKNGTALSFIDIKGLGSGGGPRSSNIFVDSNVFEHELGQQFLGTQGTRTWGADVVRQFTIDPINTEQGWGMSSQSYRTGLEPASFSAPTNPQQ
jgi:RHS repeat-associated protein